MRKRKRRQRETDPLELLKVCVKALKAQDRVETKQAISRAEQYFVDRMLARMKPKPKVKVLAAADFDVRFRNIDYSPTTGNSTFHVKHPSTT